MTRDMRDLKESGILFVEWTGQTLGFVKQRYGPRQKKTCLKGFRPDPTQIGLYSHRRWLED